MKTSRFEGISDPWPLGYHPNNSPVLSCRILKTESYPGLLKFLVEYTNEVEVVIWHGSPTGPWLLLGPTTVNADGGPAIVATNEQLYGLDKQLE
jgi:hypothetical protein